MPTPGAVPPPPTDPPRPIDPAPAHPPGRAYRHLVSVKGVCLQAGRVLLLRNEREEWELPGGQLERGEDPQAGLAREIAEESGWQVRVGPIWTAGSATSVPTSTC
jgi:8-oxo-dGTP pyrophosphatase MutT (NUDIX family)